MPVFVEKTSNLSKILCSHVIFFFKFEMKNPAAVMPISYLIKKRQFCQNWFILWIKKVNRMSFFSDFNGKITSLIPIFCKENVHSGKNTMLFSPDFIKKKRPVS